MSIAYGLNPEDLSQSGWGLLLPAEMDQSTREAILKGLQPLLELRRSQTGSVFRLFTQETGVSFG